MLRTEPGKTMNVRLTSPEEPAKAAQTAVFPASLTSLGFCLLRAPKQRPKTSRKCKLLLHLGNQLSFFVDKEK